LAQLIFEVFRFAIASAGKIKATATTKTAMTTITSTRVSALVGLFEKRGFMAATGFTCRD
jgi:hypothetical protein